MTNQTPRRTVLQASALSSVLLLPKLSAAGLGNESVKLGIIADLHGGLAQDADQRLDAFLTSMARQKCDALIQMGDFAFPNEKHKSYAEKFNAAHKEVVHVIGNHEFDYGLTRQDCFRSWGIDASHYVRDIGGIRFIVLDGNEKRPSHRGGYPSHIGENQQRWLKEQLRSSEIPVVVLSHQPLAGHAAIDNAAELQSLLANFKSKILLCINGHSHLDALYRKEGVSYLHLNSASYYWVGGETRMAYYSEPLFTTLTINGRSGTIEIAASSGRWSDKSPEQIGYFDNPASPPREMVTPQIRARTLGTNV